MDRSVGAAGRGDPRLRVLLVDDMDAVRSSLAEVLRVAGFEVIEASDGHTALETMALFEFDAMVLDLAMPRLDGMGVLERLDQEDPTPVVLVTASDYESAVVAHGDRIFGVMKKPVSPDVLIAIVGEAATSGRASRR